MILSQTAEYALRAMAWIATRENGEAVRAKDLSEAADIPPHYVSKILRRLVLADLLISQKGHGGGFTLSRAPGEIRYIDILQAVDAAPLPNQCAFGWGECDLEHPCPLHRSWSRISDAFQRWAEQRTLADVTPADDAMRLRRNAARER